MAKNDVNIEEMIADVGFGFHAVRVSFLKPEKVCDTYWIMSTHIG